jgi:hypothetical protein
MAWSPIVVYAGLQYQLMAAEQWLLENVVRTEWAKARAKVLADRMDETMRSEVGSCWRSCMPQYPEHALGRQWQKSHWSNMVRHQSSPHVYLLDRWWTCWGLSVRAPCSCCAGMQIYTKPCQMNCTMSRSEVQSQLIANAVRHAICPHRGC